MGSYWELGTDHLKIVNDHALPTNISIMHSIKRYFKLEPDLWNETIRSTNQALESGHQVEA